MALRTHVVLPEDLVAEVDRLAGKRKRSAFIEDAVRSKVRREKLGEALQKCAGILNPDDYPYWSTPEKTSEWVRESRRRDDERWERKVGSRLRGYQEDEVSKSEEAQGETAASPLHGERVYDPQHIEPDQES